jgi:hypothetical protein
MCVVCGRPVDELRDVPWLVVFEPLRAGAVEPGAYCLPCGLEVVVLP